MSAETIICLRLGKVCPNNEPPEEDAGSCKKDRRTRREKEEKEIEFKE